MPYTGADEISTSYVWAPGIINFELTSGGEGEGGYSL